MKIHNSPSKAGNKRKMCDRRDEDGEEERKEIRDVVGKLEEELKEEMKQRLEQLSASLLVKLEKDRQEKRNKIGNIIRNLGSHTNPDFRNKNGRNTKGQHAHGTGPGRRHHPHQAGGDPQEGGGAPGGRWPGRTESE